MIKRILLVALALLILSPVSALAAFYGGAAIGNSWYNHDPEATDVQEISENSTGWKIFGGFTSESIFGLEGGYRDLGKVETDVVNLGAFDSKTTGWDVEALAHVKLSIFDIFGKAGAFFWNTEVNSVEETGTSFLWGLGAGVTLGPIGLRLEWESMEVSTPDNLTMLSLGATLGF